MDLKSILVKFVGGLAFSYGMMAFIADAGQKLYHQTYVCAIDALNCHPWPWLTTPPSPTFGTIVLPPNYNLIPLLLMAVGLVLLAYEFFPAKAKK